MSGLTLFSFGHLVFDVSFDAGVGLKKVSAGPIPFFAITHHSVTPAREFVISSAGSPHVGRDTEAIASTQPSWLGNFILTLSLRNLDDGKRPH